MNVGMRGPKILLNSKLANIGLSYCLKHDEKKYAETFKFFIQGAEKTSDRPPTLYDSCIDRFDMYDGIEKLMKYAKGVSAKSHTFNQDGVEVSTDFS